LSTDDSALADVQRYFSTATTSLLLNPAKCQQVSIDHVREHGLLALGTCIGSRTARQTFLEDKIALQASVLTHFPLLPSQHALLLLRQCVQQNLRHLQRTLRTDDLTDLWIRLDNLLVEAVRTLRGSTLQPSTDAAIISLPAKMGGLGLLSHQEVAPHAYAAQQESSNILLSRIFHPHLPAPPLNGCQSQGSRCHAIFVERHSTLLSNLSESGARALVDNASVVGRRWLTTIPFSSTLSLTDTEVSSALHNLTLCPSSSLLDTALTPSFTSSPPFSSSSTHPTHHCNHCGLVNLFGHDDVCSGRANIRLARHELIKKLMAKTLAAVPDTTVLLEPKVPGSSERTDFRVSGPAAIGSATSEFDLAVVTIHSQFAAEHAAIPTTGPANTPMSAAVQDSGDEDTNPESPRRSLVTSPPPSAPSPSSPPASHIQQEVLRSILSSLDAKAREKNNNYRGRTATQFHPLVLSLGGTFATETEHIIRQWATLMGPTAYSYFARQLSLTLVRMRAQHHLH